MCSCCKGNGLKITFILNCITFIVQAHNSIWSTFFCVCFLFSSNSFVIQIQFRYRKSLYNPWTIFITDIYANILCSTYKKNLLAATVSLKQFIIILLPRVCVFFLLTLNQRRIQYWSFTNWVNVYTQTTAQWSENCLYTKADCLKDSIWPSCIIEKNKSP